MKCFQCVLKVPQGSMGPIGPKEEVTRLNGTPLCWEHARGQLNCQRCIAEGNLSPKKGSVLFMGTLLCTNHAIEAELEEKAPKTIPPKTSRRAVQ